MMAIVAHNLTPDQAPTGVYSTTIYLLSWQSLGGEIELPIGAFSTRDKLIDASRALSIGFVLWGENTSNETILGVNRVGRWWLTELEIDKTLTMEDV